MTGSLPPGICGRGDGAVVEVEVEAVAGGLAGGCGWREWLVDSYIIDSYTGWSHFSNILFQSVNHVRAASLSNCLRRDGCRL